MDPNKALANIAAGLQRDESAEVSESCRALREWLRKGGFAPEWSAFPQAAQHFGRNYLSARERSQWGIRIAR